MDIETLGPAVSHTVDHPLQPTTNQESLLVVANGTINPALATSLITHGNDRLFFISDFYRYAKDNTDTPANIPAKPTTVLPQMKTKTRICLFLPGWLTSVKHISTEK